MKKAFAFCILILFTSFCYSQEYSFVQYSVKEGLPQTQVYALDADDDGYIWLGTAGGVGKFNGKYFQNYSNENGLVDNVVTDICHYHSFIWIFTNKGVTRIKGKETISYDLTNILKGNHIAAAEFRSKTNSLIIATKGNELIEIPINKSNELSTENVVNIKSEIEFSTIRHLLEDKNGNIWISSNGSFGYIDISNTWNQQNIKNSTHNVSDIKQDTKGNFYISVYGEGIYLWNQEIINHFTQEKGLVSQLIRTLFIDSNGKIWASSKNGVSRIDNDEIYNFTLKNGLPNENIETICEDLEGNIWMASDGSGAFRFTSDEFVSYRESSGMSSNYVMSIIQDSAYNYWFGTYGTGITKFDTENFSYYAMENNILQNNIVWSAYKDTRNRLWFGTSNGITLFDKNKFITYSDEPWLASNKVTSIYEHPIKKEIWLGTSKGVSIFSETDKRTIKQSEALPLKNIRTISKGVNNKTWLGTSNGIFVTDGSFYEPWIYNDQLSDKVVYSIKNYKDSLWFIGTASGLYYTNGNEVVKMKPHPSFGANYINFIDIESNRYLWVGTNYGIFEIDLFSYLNNQTQGILHHTENSGLSSVETNLNAIYIDEKNQVWMGTGNGLVKFDRQRRKYVNEELIPNISITNVQLFLKETDWTKYTKAINKYSEIPEELNLSYRNNYLTFYFEGISLTHPDELTYRIILEGLDEEWTPNINQTSFTYPNLSYGEYTFKVKASIDGIHWSEPVSFSFIIEKPYYLTWWFILICVFLIFTLTFIIYKWRVSVKTQRENTEKLVYKSRLLALEQQTLNASMNRHFIFNALNSIQYYINSQDRLSANKYLTSFAKLIRKNLDSSVSVSGLVTIADEIERLNLYITLEHMRFQEKFDFEIDIDEKVDQKNTFIPPMILQPFVENSIWHGLLPKEKGGKLWVRIYEGTNGIVFEIEDNGIGYDTSLSRKTENSHQSKGMLITSGRLEILKKVNSQKMTIKGPFQMHGEDGKVIGTKVIMVLENSKA